MLRGRCNLLTEYDFMKKEKPLNVELFFPTADSWSFQLQVCSVILQSGFIEKVGEKHCVSPLLIKMHN